MLNGSVHVDFLYVGDSGPTGPHGLPEVSEFRSIRGFSAVGFQTTTTRSLAPSILSLSAVHFAEGSRGRIPSRDFLPFKVYEERLGRL